MTYKLSDIFDLQMGKTPDRHTSEYWMGGTEPWISIADLSRCDKYINKTSELITELAVNESGIKLIPANTVIMSFKLSIGKLAITPMPMYSNEAIMAFVDKKVLQIDPSYLFYLLMQRDWDEGTNKAVMGKTLNKATLSQVRIKIHNPDKQAEVVSVLEKVRSLIASRKQQLMELDNLVKARFVELFGDPVVNPMRWQEAELLNHLEIIGGYAFKSEGFREAGIPVLRIGNINSGYFLPVNMVYWSDDPALERYKMYPGDLVMSLTGTVGKDDYGNVCILGDEFPEYYLNQRNAKLLIKPSVNKHYLSELLKFAEIKGQLTGINRGIRQANISNKDILHLCVPIPPVELQQQFSAFVTQIDKSKVVVQKALDRAQMLFDSLMQQYFE